MNPPPPAGEKDLDPNPDRRGPCKSFLGHGRHGNGSHLISFESPQLREYYMRLAQGHTGIYPHQPQHLYDYTAYIGLYAWGTADLYFCRRYAQYCGIPFKGHFPSWWRIFVLSEVEKSLSKVGVLLESGL